MANEIILASLAKYWQSRGLNLTDRRYRQLAKEGKAPEPNAGPKPPRGTVDALEALARLAAYYQGQYEGDGDTCLNDERKRKTKAEADMAEMERDLMSESLVRLADILAEWQQSIIVVKTDLQALPKRLAKYPEAKQTAEKIIHQILTNYARPRGIFKHGKKA